MDRTSLLLCSRDASHTVQTGRGRRAIFMWLQSGAPLWSIRAVCGLMGDYGPPTFDASTGSTQFLIHGVLHRLHGPALIWRYGTLEWFQHGKLHRGGDLPASISPSGTEVWAQNGKIHRDGDLPARIWYNGEREWWKHGKQHRDGDLPAVTRNYGVPREEWWKNGKMERWNSYCWGIQPT